MSLFTFGYPTPIPHNPNSHYTQTPTVHTVPTLRHNQSSPLMASPQPIFSMPPTPPITPPSDAFKQPQARQSSARSSRRASPGTLDLNTSSYGLGGNTTSIPQRRRQQNPLQRSTDQRTTAKREEFLEGVRERRSERVFDGRGDRLLQLDYLTERRRWEAEQAANAPSFVGEEEDEETSLPPFDYQGSLPRRFDTGHSTGNQDTTMDGNPQSTPHGPPTLEQLDQTSGIDDSILLDDVLAAENRELEELVRMHEDQAQDQYQNQNQNEANHRMDDDSPWGSDDEDESFEGELLRLVDGGNGYGGPAFGGSGGFGGQGTGHEVGEAMDLS